MTRVFAYNDRVTAGIFSRDDENRVLLLPYDLP
jgi:hypothetical protein